MDLLRKLWERVTRDFTGGGFTREASPSYFGKIVYVGFSDPSKSYWEDEVIAPDGRVLTAEFENGQVHRVVVDG